MLAILPPPDPNFFYQLVSSIGVLAAIVAAILALFIKRRGIPQPLRTQSEIRLATWEEMQTLRREFEHFRKAIDDQHERMTEKLEKLQLEIARAGEARATTIHNRINELLAAVGRLQGRLEDK